MNDEYQYLDYDSTGVINSGASIYEETGRLAAPQFNSTAEPLTGYVYPDDDDVGIPE